MLMRFEYLFSKIYHELSKHHVRAPIDADSWPDEWKMTEYKSYPRLRKVNLPDLPQKNYDLFVALQDRASRRQFPGLLISLEEISMLLKFSCGTNRYDTGYNPALGRYRHFRTAPSAGARFPLETYIIVFKNLPDIQAGVYHYDILHHRLDVLKKLDFNESNLREFIAYAWARKSTFMVILTSVFERSQMKYGERGYRYIHLEAGHVSQNFYLVSQALGLSCGAYTGVKDRYIEKLLDIDGYFESYIFSLCIGK